MTTHAHTNERHEHKGPQCKTSSEAVCHENQCLHDHHVSKHPEVSCKPVHGKADTYECVHTAR